MSEQYHISEKIDPYIFLPEFKNEEKVKDLFKNPKCLKRIKKYKKYNNGVIQRSILLKKRQSKRKTIEYINSIKI
tara:strand:- start:84 stop:308 length:225 start_codon:yes stop_codon:yes gene_type:complete